MSTSNRASIYNKIYKVLKKHYTPIEAVPDRSVLQHLIYACCLENNQFDKADDAYAKVTTSFYDWNEVRVTTIKELSEVLSALCDRAAGSTRIKRVLQGVFESCYSFDLEFLQKQNIGKAIKSLDSYGATPFAAAYVTQHALAGHSIPKAQSTFQVLYIVGAISEIEAEKKQSPGLERTISKKKGLEFASLLQQLSADMAMHPYSSAVRAKLLEIDPGAKPRLPKRPMKKKQKKAPKKASSKSTKKVAALKKNRKKTTERTAKKVVTTKKKNPLIKKKAKATERRISRRKPK